MNTRKLNDFLLKTFLAFKIFQFYFSLIFVFPGAPDTAGRELYCVNCIEKTVVDKTFFFVFPDVKRPD